MVSDYDRRQIQRMRARIDAFESRKLYLGPLIADLEFLANAIEELGSVWKQDFVYAWSELEEAYANASARNATELNDEESAVVLESLDELKQLLAATVPDDTDSEEV